MMKTTTMTAPPREFRISTCKFWLRRALILGLVLACYSPVSAGYLDDKQYPILTDTTFTADAFILDQAKFWCAIYLDVGEEEGLIHDPFYPDMVFKKIAAPGTGRNALKAVEVQVEAQRQEIRAMLAKDSSLWTPEEGVLKSRFPSFWDSTAITLSLGRLRFQRGLKAKFRAGLERSYRYLPLIESTLTAEGVPARLKYLPHVESSFYPYAYSKVGAAGMWQFMKSSARRYSVSVGYLVDDRRDPYVSSRAAARMLAQNFARLKSWPLAIVAYNHGPGGLASAVRGTGTRDLGTIIKSYYSNSFGFASKNFYAEFLAASSIALHADSLFPDLKKMEPLRFQSLVLTRPIDVKQLGAMTGLSPDELEEYNLGLRPATFRGNTQLPKGFVLRLPVGIEPVALATKLSGGRAIKDNTGNVDADAKPTAIQPIKSGRKPKVAKISESDIASIRPADETPEVKKPVPVPSPVVPDVVHIVDTNLALQASDLDKLSHPMDQFHSDNYNLQSSYADGFLTIRVGTEETLSHYAEWAAVSEPRLRQANHMQTSKDLRIGRSIRIPLGAGGAGKAEDFLKRREEYYRAIEEDFYSNYYVSISEPVVVQKGMNLWTWAMEKEIPFWLLQKHNAGKSLNAIHPGDTLNMPVIETGIRKWGFTRYANTKEYLAGIARFLNTGRPEAY